LRDGPESLTTARFRIIHGYRRPYRDELRRIAAALDLTVDELRATNVLNDEDGPQAA
jgi:hypothetical protein